MSSKKVYNVPSHYAGFSLLESLLAIGIIATVGIQLLGMSRRLVDLDQSTLWEHQASWLLQSFQAQFQYVMDVYGLEKLPESIEFEVPKALFKLKPRGVLSVKLEQKIHDIPVSHFVDSLIQLKNSGQPSEEDPMISSLKEQLTLVDQMIPSDVYHSVELKVQEVESGQLVRAMSVHSFVVNEKKLMEAAMGASKLKDMMGPGGDSMPSNNNQNPSINNGSDVSNSF